MVLVRIVRLGSLSCNVVSSHAVFHKPLRSATIPSLTLFNVKRSENIALRVSPPVKNALIHIAERESKKDISAAVLEAVLTYISDRGISLSPECPEYRVLEAAPGTANANLAELIDKAIPIAREKSKNWAAEYAQTRFIKVWSQIEEFDDPKLYNDAHEVFSDPSRTPREKIRAMEFRLESYLKARGRL